MPYSLVEQMANGGKMVVPVGPAGSQILVLVTKHGKKLVQRHLMSVAFVPFVRDDDARVTRG